MQISNACCIYVFVQIIICKLSTSRVLWSSTKPLVWVEEHSTQATGWKLVSLMNVFTQACISNIAGVLKGTWADYHSRAPELNVPSGFVFFVFVFCFSLFSVLFLVLVCLFFIYPMLTMSLDNLIFINLQISLTFSNLQIIL